jgi:hypothetical protein
MSDVVYRPNPTANPTPPPAEAPPTSAQHIDNPIDTGSEQENIRESVKELNRKRREEGTAVEEPEPVKIHYEDDRTLTGYKGFKEAVRDQSDRHRLQKPDAQILQQWAGKSREETLDLVKDPEFHRVHGFVEPEDSGEYARTGERPPTRMYALNEKTGEIRPPLDEHRPLRASLDPEDVLTPREAAREQGNWRAALAQQEAANLQKLSEMEQEAQQAQQEAQPQPQPQAQPRPQQPAQPDPCSKLKLTGSSIIRCPR